MRDGLPGAVLSAAEPGCSTAEAAVEAARFAAEAAPAAEAARFAVELVDGNAVSSREAIARPAFSTYA